jgi:hypothetical protein
MTDDPEVIDGVFAMWEKIGEEFRLKNLLESGRRNRIRAS